MSTTSPDINLDYVNALRLILPVTDTITLTMIGCGGTGSWLAPAVVRVARLLGESQRKRVLVYFVDPDLVEAKNVYRQNFCEAEIGRSKAEALAFRYGLAWGVEISAVPTEFSPGQIEASPLNILIGCVDNAAARKSIREATHNRARAWWLDCGNSQSSGQILLGCGAQRPKDPYELPGFCSWLPSPSLQHPELLQVERRAFAESASLSCADMALRDSQGMAINQRIAAEAADYLVRMLITKDLFKLATYIDLASGTTKSKYITKETA